MIKIELSEVINRPVEEVFAFVADMETRPQWMSSVEEAHWTSEGPWGVGSTFRTMWRFMGPRAEDECVFTEYEPNRKYSYKSHSGPGYSLEVRVIFDSVEGGTRYGIAFQADVGGLFKITEPILARMFRRVLKADVANLKDMLEAQGGVSGRYDSWHA